jgi:hypothetical protein
LRSEIIVVGIPGAIFLAILLYVLFRAARKPAIRVKGRRRMEYSGGMKITAVMCLAIGLFIAWAASQASASQIVTAYFVALGLLGIEVYLFNEVFLTKLEYDGHAIYHRKVFDREVRIPWTDVQQIAYKRWTRKQYLQLNSGRSIELSPMRKGVREFGQFLQHKLFWQFIAQANDLGPTDVTARSALFLAALRPLPVARVRGIFSVLVANLIQSNTWPLKGAAELMGAAKNEEEFVRFRCALIARGIVPFFKILKEPDSLANDNLSKEEWFDGSLLEALREVLSEMGVDSSATMAAVQSALPADKPLDKASLASVLAHLTEKYGLHSGAVNDNESGD